MTVLVGVVDGDVPSRRLLGSRPDVRYVFIDPASEPPAEAFDVDALMMWNVRTGFLREHWSRFTRLRWVHSGTAGVERVLFPELAAGDVVLTNSRYIFDQALAEYTIGLMLALTKDLVTTFRHQTEHRWVQRETETLSGKTAVLVGVGPIARRIAQIATALGMSVRGIGRTARAGDADFGDIAAPDALPSLFTEADYVVMVLPSTPQTAGMVDAEAIGRLKPTARLVNVGRGSTLDQDALCDALRAGRLAGAALDVMRPEPLPADSPLWDVPNLIISPHMSGDHSGWQRDIADLFARNLDRFLRGETLLNVVDKRLGYAPSVQA
ncbi:MAG TPA: D-2-hydroxyacid dehydrogenase [Candidatus Saccharimonadales bacterium]|nr:D-2-hydroxyacid dehydrogenase [Candidatus Saccharimonadales bacterium]